MKTSRSEFVVLNGLRYHLRIWGESDSPKLFLLHGWMDCSATFQFLVDALASPWQVIAPDWRGFGRSEWPARPYWFPDYLADLDALLDRASPGEPARVVGHSMGGNIACLYAGVRPERVRALASLEGLGLPPVAAEEAPDRYGKWLDAMKAPPAARPYRDVDALVQRLRADNPRLTAGRARFLAGEFSVPAAGGGVMAAADAWHRAVYPVCYRLEEAKACWRRIRAPVLWVRGRDSSFGKMFEGREEDVRSRLGCFLDLREAVLEDCGHGMQHDQPEALARVLEAFFRATAPAAAAREV